MGETVKNGSPRPPKNARWRVSVAIAAAVFLIVVVAGIVGYIMTGPADARPTAAETLAATSMRRAFVPLRARAVSQPPIITTAALVEGRSIFRQRCSLCHGGSGKADSSLAAAFYPPVPDVAGRSMLRWSDRELFWIIQNGIRMTGMPAWRSSLSEQQTWDVVGYIRHLSNASGNKVGGSGDDKSDAGLRKLALQTIEDEGCQDCHTIDGAGAKIGPNLSEEWARGRSDNWLIGHLRHPSSYTPGTPMPSFDHLSDRQLKALVRYLQDSSK